MWAWILWIAIPTVLLVTTIRMAGKDKDRLDMWKGRYIAPIIVSAVVLLFTLIAALATNVETRACEQQATLAGYEGKWTSFTDCMVHTPEGWFPLDQILELRNP